MRNIPVRSAAMRRSLTLFFVFISAAFHLDAQTFRKVDLTAACRDKPAFRLTEATIGAKARTRLEKGIALKSRDTAAAAIQPNAGTCSVTETSCGRTESGSFTASDCTLDSDNTRLDFWIFNGQAGQQVTITMRSTAFDAYLALLDPDLEVVAENDDGAGGTDSRIVYTLGSTGVWTIAANQFEPALGNYTLTLECDEAQACTYNPIACGQTLSGTLSSADCTLGDGTYVEGWEFTGVAGQRIVATMRSSSFDAYLGLIDPQGVAVAEDDDSGGGSDAKIDFVLNATGTWTLVANSFSVATGNYTIELACPASNTCTTCTPDSRTACLLGGRFKVTVPVWRDLNANLSGQGRIITYAENREQVHPDFGPLSAGAFFSMYDFAPDSIEVIVRIIKGQNINNHYWVFATGFTGTEYTLRVQDIQTCGVWERMIPAGVSNVLKDFEAFPFP